MQIEGFKKDFFEAEAWKEGHLVVGVDEVGRGCLAGPVVTAAVALWGKKKRFLKDSKVMTAPEREAAYAWIVKNAYYAVGIVDHRTIDSINIWHATLKAMKKAVLHLNCQLATPPVAIVVDAMPLKLANTSYSRVPVHHFPFGESRSSSIAAASIVAKVTRDRLMQHFASLFEHYRLGEHKGYATIGHRRLVQEHGRSLIHRVSFFVEGLEDMNQQFVQESDYDQQQTLW